MVSNAPYPMSKELEKRCPFLGINVEWLLEHSISLLTVVAVLAMSLWLTNRLKVRWIPAIIFSIANSLWGLLAMRGLAIVEAGFDISRAANLRIYGATFAIPALYYVSAKLFKRKPADFFDACTVILMFDLFLGRLNCIFAGCCEGCILKGSIRWPIRELELLYYIVMMIIFGVRVYKKKTSGEVYPIYMISYGILRLIIEPFRVEYDALGAVHFGTIWSVISIIMGLSIYYTQQEKIKRKMGVQKK